MSEKTSENLKKSHRNYPSGFMMLISALAISAIVVIAAVLVYSHHNYKSSQKKLFVEKWDSIALRISGEASKAINDAGLIDDEFASYLYWIPAISKEIVAIKLVDDQNNPIYTTGILIEDSDIINEWAKNALKGKNQFLFPEESGSFHTIIAAPVYVNDGIGAVLLLTVNDYPENIGIKSAIFRTVVFALIALIFWSALVIGLLLRLKRKVDSSEIINRLQAKLAVPTGDKSKSIMEDGLKDIIRIFYAASGSVYIKNPVSGEFEPAAIYPTQEKDAKKQPATNFDPGDPRLQAVIYEKTVIYDSVTKRSIALKDIGKSVGEITVAIPLRAYSGVYGTAVLTFIQKNTIDPKKLQVLKQALDIYSRSIYTALDIEHKSTVTNNLQYILDIIETLSSADFVKAALGKISEKIASTPAVSYCGIYILDEKNKRLILAAEAYSGEGLSFKPENIAINIEDMPAHKIALISGQSQILRIDEIERMSLSKQNLFNPKMECGSIHIAPLLAGNVRIGCISIGTVEEGDEIYNKKGFFDNIAHYLSLVMKNILRYSEVKKSFEQLRSTHEKQLKLARFNAVSDLAEGIAKNLDSIMHMLLEDLKKLADPEADKSLPEITELIDSHVNQYKLVLQRIEEFLSANTSENFRQIEVAHILGKTEKRLKEESSQWPVNLDKIRIVILNSGSGQILGDEEELHKAISNIIQNAAEAMPYGGDIVLESRIDGKLAILEITDQGSGMNDNEISRIFEPFFTTKNGLARGLGLSMAQKIVIHHNGELIAKSKPGKGSVITMGFPLIDPEQTALYTSKMKSSSTSIPLS